ncbi:YigZ family protein [Kocuria rhizophila]|uniref:IMPACT family protein n=1 Tax=Kocuria rhizophila TaxID=72000 RepID=UPI0025B01EE8|nr:YigZ family protein [Kocuria rhizophila]MDN3225636.1 YigZ family protein [Kocuria rhizophila]
MPSEAHPDQPGTGHAPHVSYTVLRAGTAHTAELEIRKSRFLAVLTRADSEEAARTAIAEIVAQHRDARHHCTAFVLGPARDTTRSSDDGEPAGTAGVPMLQALTQFATPHQHEAQEPGDLSDVCAVVVRWFGGVKLGAGGLVRAYSGAVTAALETAPLARRLRCRELSVSAPHAEAGRIEAELRSQDYTMLPTGYDAAHATLNLLVPDHAAQIARAHEDLAAATSGLATVVEGTTRWEDVPLG